MKKALIVALSSALALGGGALIAGAHADMQETHTTTTTEKSTTYKGTVSEIDPSSSTIVVKSETTTAAPTKYTYTKETVFTDPAGKVVSYDAIRNQPVTVYYTRDGDRTIVTKVVSTKPAEVTHRETTTTETHD